MINSLFIVGLIDFLIQSLNPSVIIVFGGVRKGEYDKDSDVDLFVEATTKKELSLSLFEKKLGHKIDLFIKKDINELPDNLFNNVVNGIKVYGYFKIK
jgi:predicted nucleotidyltransferase